MTTMTLEQVRDDMLRAHAYSKDEALRANTRKWVSAIDAHLAQPAQAVDVGGPDAWAWRSDGMTGWALGHVKPTPENTHKFHERNTVVRGLYFADRALSGEKAGPVGDGWQPIETAPKDRTDILASDATEMLVTYWYGGSIGWLYSHSDNDVAGWHPTHWMPLPASPTPDKEG